MTQKELLYTEDAVKHECNIISILDYMENNLEDEDLVTFVKDEIKSHNKTKKELINLLKENVND